MYKSVISFLVLVISVNCQSCSNQTTYNLTVLQSIDGDTETTTSTGIITLKKDSFSLLVANGSIPRLCENLITIRSELSVIQIFNSSVQEIDKGAFNVTPTLTLLKISSNLLKTIQTGVFNSLKVKEIDLSHNFISSIEESAFDNITNLEIVKLNYNLLKQINPNWFKNTAIYKLSVIYNEVTELVEDQFKNFVDTRPLKLRLSANQISKIHPNAFGGHRRIETLRFNGNKLDSLPPTVFINRTIDVIHVNTNNLKCFPGEFFQSEVKSLEFFENSAFECGCLKRLKEYVEKNNVDITYPAIICEDKANEVNIVFNFNKTYVIPLLEGT